MCQDHGCYTPCVSTHLTQCHLSHMTPSHVTDRACQQRVDPFNPYTTPPGNQTRHLHPLKTDIGVTAGVIRTIWPVTPWTRKTITLAVLGQLGSNLDQRAIRSCAVACRWAGLVFMMLPHKPLVKVNSTAWACSTHLHAVRCPASQLAGAVNVVLQPA